MKQILQGIDAVYFDLDDTLYDQLEPFGHALMEAMPHLDWGKLPVAELFRRVRHYSDRLWDRHAAGGLDLEEMRIRRLTLAFGEMGLPVSGAEAESIQERYAARQSRISLSAGAAELIGALKATGREVGIMTNGPTEHQKEKIRVLGLDRVVDGGRIFISDAIGIAKPDPAVFAYICARTGRLPERCLYVGDAWQNDIAASSAAGWRPVWLNRRGVPAGGGDGKPVLVVDDLRRLLELPQLR